MKSKKLPDKPFQWYLMDKHSNIIIMPLNEITNTQVYKTQQMFSYIEEFYDFTQPDKQGTKLTLMA